MWFTTYFMCIFSISLLFAEIIRLNKWIGHSFTANKTWFLKFGGVAIKGRVIIYGGISVDIMTLVRIHIGNNVVITSGKKTVGLFWIFERTNKSVKSCSKFFGKISLESYLFNTGLGGLIVTFCPFIYNSSMNTGCYLSYGLVLVGGTIMAYLVHKLCGKIIKLTLI